MNNLVNIEETFVTIQRINKKP